MENENKVLAKVGEIEITQSDVNTLHKSVGPEKMLHYSSAEGQKQLLEELISQELLLQDAKNKKLHETKDFIDEVEKIKENVLKQLALRELLKKVTISDEFVKDYYEENIESFKKAESWKAAHILVDTKEEADKIYQEIQEGKNFADAANEYSKCPSRENGGDLGFFTAGQMVKEFEDSVKEMKIGEIKNSVATQFGFHLINLTDKKDSNLPAFDEVKDELKNQLLLIHQEKTYIETAEELKKSIKVEYL